VGKTTKEKRFRPMGRLLLRLLLLRLFLPTSILIVLMLSLVSLMWDRSLRSQQMELARASAHTVESFLTDAERMLSSVASVADLSEEEALSLYLRSTREGFGHFDTLYRLDENGIIVMLEPYEPGYVGLDQSGQSYYKQTQETGAFTISQPFNSMRTGKPTVYMAWPLADGGMMVGELNLETLQDAVTAGHDEQGRSIAFIVDHAGMLLAHPRTELVAQQTRVGYMPIVQRGQVGEATLHYRSEGQWMLGSSTQVQGPGWVVVVQAPLSAVYGPLLQAAVPTVLLSLVVWVALIFTFRQRFWQHVVAPLTDLSRIATIISAGDLKQRAQVGGEDEVGVLASAFNHMTARLGDLIRSLEQEVAERKRVEEALCESEENYRGIFENAVEGIYQTSFEGRVLSANPALARILGYDSPEELVTSLTEIRQQLYVHPEDRDVFLSSILDRGTVLGLEFQFYRKGGQKIWVSLNARMVRDEAGAPLFFEGFITDITARKQAEEMLRESEQKFRSIIESSSEGFALVDEQGVIIEWNPAREKMTGLPASQVIGRKLWDVQYQMVLPELRTPEFYNRFKQSLSNALQTGQSPLFDNVTEAKVMHPHRPSQFIQQTIFPIKTNKGYRIGSMTREITERKQAEEALRESEMRYRAVVEAFDGLIYVCSPDYRVEFMNERFIERTGYDGTGELCYKALHDLDSICPWCVNERVFNGETVRWEVLSPRDDRWYYVVNTPIYHADGSMSKQAMILDITERKQAEEELQSSNELLRAIIEAAPIAIIGLDLDGNVQTVWNPAAEKMLGWSAQEIMGHPLPSVSTESQEEFRGFREQIRRGLTLDGMDVRRQRRDGSLIDYSIYASPLHDAEGRITGNIAILVDITERKRIDKELRAHRDRLEELVRERTAELVVAKDAAEEALRLAEAASQAKSAFLANMSHELRTPLNAILGYAQILQRRPLAPDVISGLNTVQRSGEHLLTLINDILDISRIETGKMKLSPAPFHFPNFLEHIASIVHARAEANGLSFRFERQDTLPTWVETDETRLRQVLLNLLDNAVKFTDEGQVTFGVQQIGESANPRILRFEVQDTGIGIAPDQAKRIFQPFEQVGDLAHRTKGTGLGLAISRQLVRLMGGDIHVQSEPGQGSTFWFELALPVTEATGEASQSPDQPITGYQGPRRTVLVVDDVPSSRAMLADLLEPLGFDVVTAADGRQAIHLAREIRPDLILMDRWMPVLDGFEAAQQIRQDSELQEAAIIAVSASVSEEDQAQSRAAGVDDFLPKPIHWPKLAALLEKHLGLEWEYEVEIETRRVRGDREKEKEVVLVPPPHEETVILYDLVRRGDMRGLRERAAHIETLGEQYVPFAEKLRELAEGFEEREILALVRQYVEQG
jgi:PAS domain S-box-containing protein